jgi:cation diffusion facilitator family transporter
VLFITFLLNEAVALAKLAWGYHTHSLGMVSDGYHSLFDGVSNLVGMVGVYLASNPPDREHPYGHRKYETLFSIAIGLMVVGTGWQILKGVYSSLERGERAAVTPTSFVVMALTVAVNLAVMLYERKRGRELGSELLVADAGHTRSNIMSSGAVVLGLLLTRAGLPLADAVAGVAIAVFVAKIGVGIIKEASDVLVDRAMVDVAAIERVACSTEGVRACHAVRARGPRGHVQIDLHVQLDPDITLAEAHRTTHRVMARLREAFPGVADIVVHTEPVEEGE